MSLISKIKSWFKSEQSELSESLDSAKNSLNNKIEKLEREQAFSPEEKMDSLQDQIDQNSDSFEELKKKISPENEKPK